ncbi:hypothetical protein RUM43_010395 [Polyplax serrata]|uniref:Uncharacterized protein n=1 Tax=Polyplax serrata TaxID=468196 RepID=A0AAN8S0F9_POLSC
MRPCPDNLTGVEQPPTLSNQKIFLSSNGGRDDDDVNDDDDARDGDGDAGEIEKRPGPTNSAQFTLSVKFLRGDLLVPREADIISSGMQIPSPSNLKDRKHNTRSERFVIVIRHRKNASKPTTN